MLTTMKRINKMYDAAMMFSEKTAPKASQVLKLSAMDVADGFLAGVGASNTLSEYDVRTNTNDFSGQAKADNIPNQVAYMKKYLPDLDNLSMIRRLSMTSIDWDISGEGTARDYIVDMFAAMDFASSIFQLTTAIENGFAVIDPKWSYIAPLKPVATDFVALHPGAIGFDRDWVPVIRDLMGNVIKISENWYRIYTFNQQYEDRYGTSLFHLIYWNWWFIVNTVKFEAGFVQGSSYGVRVIEQESGENAPVSGGVEYEEAIATLKQVVESDEPITSISLPPGFKFSILTNDAVTSGGASKTYDHFRRMLEREISRVFVGHASLFDQDGGSYAAAKEKQELTSSIYTASDARGIAGFINGKIIDTVISIAFPSLPKAAYPRWVPSRRPDGDLEAFSRIIFNLAEAGHNRIPINYVNQRIGIPVLPENEGKYLNEATASAMVQFSAEMSELSRQNKLSLEKKNETINRYRTELQRRIAEYTNS